MITLNQNIFVGTITNLIAYSIYHDNYRLGDDIDRLLEIFRSDDVPMGDGKVVHTADLPTVVDLNPNTSSLLTVTKPVLQEQYIPVSEYKKVPLSINEYLLRGAFTDEGALGLLASYLINTMQIAKKLHMYNRVRSAIYTVFHHNTGETLTGKTIATTDTAVESNAKRTYNTNLLYRALIRIIKQAGKGLNTVVTGGSDVGDELVCYDRADNLVAIISDGMLASLDVDTLATLLNSNEITRNVPIELLTMDFGNIFDPEEESVEDIGQGTVIIMSKDKVQYGFFYQVATQFFDASNLNTQNWLHFSDYCGQVYRALSYNLILQNFNPF